MAKREELGLNNRKSTSGGGQPPVSVVRKKMLSVRSAEGKSYYEVVHRALREAIIRGILPIGKTLVTVSLAQEMGVSRTPVRDALSRLEALGLVRRDGRSYAVIGLTPEDVDQIAFVRRLLESTAAELAATRISGSEIAFLQSLATGMYQAVEGGDPGTYRSLHRSFHAQIVSCARNVYLARTLDSIMDFVDLVWEATIPTQQQHVLGEAQHRQIIDALRAHDARAASQAVAGHIEKGMRLIKLALERKQAGRTDLRGVMEIVTGG